MFFKIDFDKVYDRLKWKDLIDSLEHMGYGISFFNMVPLGNAYVTVCANKDPTDILTLARSIQQEYPVAPLLYAIVVDVVN